MIEMEDIKKAFRLGEQNVEILKGLSLTIGPGEFVSIMGPSGSGKSTLSSILGCLSTPSSGRYKLDGKEVTALSSRELAKLRNQKIGFIFQDFNLLDGLTAVENVALPLFYSGISAGERRKRAVECLRTVGLESRINHLPSQLSGGQKQRVAIARALINQPAFLFADEPTGALDKNTGREIMGLMQKLNFLGHTVVQVTHSPVDANYSKRILHLVDGHIIRDEFVERPTVGVFSHAEQNGVGVEGKFWRVLQFTTGDPAKIVTEIQTLLSLSTNQDSLVEAVRAVARWDDPQAVELYRQLSRNEHWGVRAEAVRLSAAKRPDLMLEICEAGLSDANAWVRYLSMAQIKRAWPFPLPQTRKEKFLTSAKDADERVRATLMSHLGQWEDPSIVTFLVEGLRDPDGRVRANALDSLHNLHRKGKIGNEPLVVAEPLLDDKNNRARANAAVLLYPVKPERAFEALTKMLLSDNNLMRASSAWALGMVPKPEAGQLLVDRMRVENEELVMNQLVRSLAKLGEGPISLKEQLSAFLSALKMKDTLSVPLAKIAAPPQLPSEPIGTTKDKP